MPTRKATATWEGTLKTGHGNLKTAAGLAGNYTFASRFESGTGTNPEELLAAAEAACFSMALSQNLEKAGKPPSRIDTEAACVLEASNGGVRISSMKLMVRAAVPGLDAASLQRIAETTRDTCPVSNALKGNVKVELESKLM